MPTDHVCPGSVRSAAQLNEDIRQMWLRARGVLTAQERAEYERLVVAWAGAVRAETGEAA